MTKDNGLAAWETNAKYWDEAMGDDSNFFHCEKVRPYTEKLLDVQFGDHILDIACGNGNFSERMAQQGANIVAFDYSPKMIMLAKRRRNKYLHGISFQVADATKSESLIELKQEKLFNKAVANMAIMDISDIAPLFKALHTLLCDKGIFVFASHHPCFTYPNKDYLTQSIEKGFAIEGQPVLHNYYHRPMEEIFRIAFSNGFVMDRFHEIPFTGENTPIIMIVRLVNCCTR